MNVEVQFEKNLLISLCKFYISSITNKIFRYIIFVLARSENDIISLCLDFNTIKYAKLITIYYLQDQTQEFSLVICTMEMSQLT